MIERGGSSKIFVFLIYLVIGLFLLNIQLNILTLPEVVTKIENWVVFIGGVLVIIAGVKYLMTPRYMQGI